MSGATYESQWEGAMALTLKIDNHSSLPDGGPLSYTLEGQRSADIGRDQHLDWSLPDPERFISGKHCEIKYQSGDYFLIDVSTNGTFVNGAPGRVQSPYRLKNGDRLQIGDYLISVSIPGEAVRAPAGPGGEARPSIDRPASYDALWDVDDEVAPPIDPRELRPQGKPNPVYGDFLSRQVTAPGVDDAAQFVPAEPLDWAPIAPKPVTTPEPPRAPEPRRRASFDDSIWAPTLAPPQAPAPRAHSPAPPSPAPRDAFLQAFASAAGVPYELLSNARPEELGALMGSLALTVASEMQQLLRARVEAKRLARSGEQTLIQPHENNPLKFTPSPEDALRIMFGPPTPSYLDAIQAIGAGFADLKRHQLQTYSAMQQAVQSIFATIDPAQIEKAAAKPQLFKDRKAQLWDAYVAAWQAQSKGQPDGIIGLFMFLFGRFYDRAGEK
jgi:type VI secretion system protein ImpI